MHTNIKAGGIGPEGHFITILIKTKTFTTILLFFLVSWTTTQAQVLKDTATLNQLCRGVDFIYNGQFNQARAIYKSISTRYPNHPMAFIFKGMITYWENYPLVPSSPAMESFEKDMRHAIDLCENKKNINTNYPEYLLSNIGARGLLLLCFADNGLSMDVISLASSTYQYVKECFKFSGTYADFYFITGLYNYYREAYPDAHPVYKPLAILFPKGDKAQGLRDLQTAAKKAIVLKAESYSFLSGIYISFENNYPQALSYSKALHDLYPQNVQYIAVYIKNLLLVKKYSDAENQLKFYRSRISNKYVQAQFQILNGIVYEKKYHDYSKSRDFYSQGIKDLAPYGEYSYEYQAYGYFGLSRISEISGNKANKRTYRKKAMEMASYKKVNFDE